MLKLDHILRRSAKRVADAAEATLRTLNSEQVQQEPAFTDRMLGRIDQAMDGFTVKGVKWSAVTLTDRGKGAQEKRYGADFLGVIDIAIKEYVVQKGFLAQAKLIEPDDSMRKADFDEMVDQCNRMLAISQSSFVFIYSRLGILTVPAQSIVSLKETTNPHKVYSRGCQRFFEEYFSCFFGDTNLQRANVGLLDELTESVRRVPTRSAQLLTARRISSK